MQMRNQPLQHSCNITTRYIVFCSACVAAVFGEWARFWELMKKMWGERGRGKEEKTACPKLGFQPTIPNQPLSSHLTAVMSPRHENNSKTKVNTYGTKMYLTLAAQKKKAWMITADNVLKCVLKRKCDFEKIKCISTKNLFKESNRQRDCTSRLLTELCEDLHGAPVEKSCRPS